MPYKVSCTSVAMHCKICTRRSLTWLSHVLPGRSNAPQRGRDGRVRQLRVLPGHMLEACVGRDLGGAWNHPLGVAESTVQLLLWGSGGSVDPGAILRRACWLACICLGLASVVSGQNECFCFPHLAVHSHAARMRRERSMPCYWLQAGVHTVHADASASHQAAARLPRCHMATSASLARRAEVPFLATSTTLAESLHAQQAATRPCDVAPGPQHQQ